MAVFLLLTAWSVAKEHCNLEALGWLPEQCESDCGQACGQDDGCETVENGYYKQSASQVHVASPELLLCVFHVAPPAPLRGVAPLELQRFSEPQTLVRTWQFFERAAPPCRAPSVIA